MPSVIVVDSPPGITSASSAVEVARRRAPRAWRRRRRRASSRGPRSRPAGRARRIGAPSSRPLPAALGQQLLVRRASSSRGSPSRRRGRARRRRRARRPASASSPPRSRGPVAAGSSDLKIPEPTNTPSAPSAIISAASAGVAMPPAQNSTTGSRPLGRDLAHESQRRRELLGGGRQLLLAERRQAA